MADNQQILVINSLNRHLISFLPRKAKKSIEQILTSKNKQLSLQTFQQPSLQLPPSRFSNKYIQYNESNLSLQVETKKNEYSLNKMKQNSTIISQQGKSISPKKNLRIKYSEVYRETIDAYFNLNNSVGPISKKIENKYLRSPHFYKKFITIEKINVPLKAQEQQNSSLKITREKIAQNKPHSTNKSINGNSFKISNHKSQAKKRQQGQQRLHRKTTDLFRIKKPPQTYRQNGNKQKIEQLPFMMQIRKPLNRKQYFIFGLGQSKSQNQNKDKLEKFRDFLWKVNYSNGLYVETPETCSNNYKIYIGRGNNSQILRFIMRRRYWWTIVDKINQPGINFYWTQLKIDELFQKQKPSQQPQFQNDQQLYKTQFEINKNIHKIFCKKDEYNWNKYMLKFGKFQQKISELTYSKRIYLFHKKKMSKIQDSSNLLIHNHLSENFYIGNKKALFYNIRNYYSLLNKDPFTIIPLTFHISRGMQDPEYKQFLAEYAKIEQSKKLNKQIRNVWIVKPGQNTNRGNGITICYGIDDIKQRLRGRQKNKDGKYRTFILQKYIQNPLLYNKRKFDIRHYLLITCINENYKAYWFDEGYIRTSSNQFTIRSNKDPLVHLTNDAIQQHGTDFGKFQRSNKVSYNEFSKYVNKISLKQKNYNGNYFEKVIIQTMKEYTLQAIRATFPLLDMQRKQHNFQLLGLDFMIDQDLKPWLIEVNTNPCLQTPCPLLQRLIPSLLQNTIRLCIDPLFPPPQIWPVNKKMYISQNAIEENRFQLIFDEKTQGFNLTSLYQNHERFDKKMGVVMQDDQVYQNDGIAQMCENLAI